MADVPVPGSELTPGPARRLDPSDRPDAIASAIPSLIPPAVDDLLARLWAAGFAAYVVGGSLRDVILGRTVADWDLATSARPEQTLALFADAVYENAFGTVAVGTTDPRVGAVEITSFRSDHEYADFRRPHRVEFGDSIELDLARRDLTVNAIAWGAEPGATPGLIDPHGGLSDLATRTLRAVGDPATRFGEDALRMLRAVRLAAALDCTIEPATLAAIASRAGLVAHLSGERLAMELVRLLHGSRPSVGLALLHDTGLLAHLSAELASQRGVPQNKVEGEDLWDHTLRAVDASPVDRPADPEAPADKPPVRSVRIRMAALLHDIGKPATMADGRFVGHETVGADLAARFLDRLRWPTAERDRLIHLIRQHMFGYESRWSDAAVRRFIVKVGREALDDLFLLREADNLASGRPEDHGDLPELRARVAAQFEAGVALDLRDLAIDGSDLMTELGLRPGPLVGRTLRGLLERAIGDPTLNTRDRLLAVARAIVAEERTS